LASAPKSNASYLGWKAARKDILAHGSLPVPMRLRNAPTGLMKTLGYGAGYKYPHDHDGGFVVEDYLPDALSSARYYEPKDIGSEAAIKSRLDALEAKRRR
jgi:putative ATPase